MTERAGATGTSNAVQGEYCGGAESAAANGRRDFALPGDRPVWGRDRPMRIEHLKLEFEFDIDRRQVQGVTTTTFRPRQEGLREAVFDAIELDVESVTDDEGRDLPFTLGDRELRIDLGRARSPRRSITTVVRYRCQPRRGLYFNLPDEGYPKRPTQIWTQGQAEDSAYYFPVFDFPGEKFTSEVIAHVPQGWTAVSNGRLEARSEDRRRKRTTWHWKQERPHPAYLITLTASEFDVVEHDADGVPVQYYGPKGSAADLERAFGRTPEMVRYFAEKIGVPYPWAKYATIAIHDFIFGGMENTSATTMTDTLLHDERAHEDYAEAADSITSHELAHQWFGDLLTCREWSHGWLNESFATYFDALFVEHQHGWDRFRYDIQQKSQQYLAEDSEAYRRPMVLNVYSEPIDIFDRHLYERGSVILDMLRTNLGDDLWWRAVNHYVSKHQEKDVLTHDFQRAIEEATGRNMDWFFQQWVWKGGHPEFKASYQWDGDHRMATVQLKQGQKPDDQLTSIYRTPMEVGFQTKQGFQRFTVQVNEAEHSFVFPLDSEPEFVSIDPAGRVLKTLEFEPGEPQLKKRLTGDPEAVGRIEAAKGLGKLASPGAIEALRAALLNEDELDYVRAEVATALGKAKSEAARDALIAGAGAEPSRVRRAVATALGNFRDEVAAKALAGFLQGRGDRSYYAQAAATTALGKSLQPSAYRALTRVIGRPSHNEVITAGALAGLGSLRDPQAIDLLMEQAEYGKHPNVRRAAVAALGELAPHADEAARLRVRERLEQLIDDPALRVQLTAIHALESMKQPASVGALNSLAGRALDGRVRRTARTAARAISEGADKGEEVKSLRDELEQLQHENQRLKDRLTKIETRLDGAKGGSASGGRAARTSNGATARRAAGAARTTTRAGRKRT